MPMPMPANITLKCNPTWLITNNTYQMAKSMHMVLFSLDGRKVLLLEVVAAPLVTVMGSGWTMDSVCLFTSLIQSDCLSQRSATLTKTTYQNLLRKISPLTLQFFGMSFHSRQNDKSRDLNGNNELLAADQNIT